MAILRVPLHDKHTNMEYETQKLIMQAIFIQVKKWNWDYWAEDQAQIRNSQHVEKCKHRVDEMIFLPSILFRESLNVVQLLHSIVHSSDRFVCHHRDVVWANVRHKLWESC